MPIDAFDHVLYAEARRFGGAARHQIRDDHAPVLGKAEAAREVGRDGLEVGADLAATQVSVLTQLS